MKARRLSEGCVATTFFLPAHLHQRLKAAARRLEELGGKEEAEKDAFEGKEGV